MTNDELKNDIQELHADVAKALKTQQKRLTNLEEHVGITDPTKH